ncbi:MAG: aminodeoxychorismate/anthranilate synthase component II [Acidimicrobiia bacterium]|nr:aminodeoxychorismate/anthranilate synthase component II [Acidimicrobiia bacterium]MYB24793.1 aminodeoxychorismate/anthranilate synthase component II [Acidimicrobiia bacterium]
MRRRVLVLDNYDSFVYILVQYLRELGAETVVARNDELAVAEALALGPEALLVSPGPGRPADTGICCAVIEKLAGRCPILGVCLGHQCIAEVFGGSIVRAPAVMHGKVSQIRHDGAGVLAGVPNPLQATRYHSLVVDPSSVPDSLEVTATTADGVIMGLRHRAMAVEGLQFHPESQMTVDGHAILANFLGLASSAARRRTGQPPSGAGRSGSPPASVPPSSGGGGSSLSSSSGVSSPEGSPASPVSGSPVT